MNHLIFDTETTGIGKPFCYDVGYKIIDDNGANIITRHFIIEQIWHNLPLFESAYYKEKRPKYVQLMRQRRAVMDKWGYIMRQLARDIKNYEIADAYGYNSKFDDNVFTFNCDWYKCNNPLETIPVYDIWGYASEYITGTRDYQEFCEENELFTDSGNYKSSAEAVYRYITGDTEFEEAHMGLHDAEIEAEILKYCLDLGAEWGTDYKVAKILTRPRGHEYKIKIDGQIIHEGRYIKKYNKGNVWSFTEG